MSGQYGLPFAPPAGGWPNPPPVLPRRTLAAQPPRRHHPAMDQHHIPARGSRGAPVALPQVGTSRRDVPGGAKRSEDCRAAPAGSKLQSEDRYSGAIPMPFALRASPWLCSLQPCPTSTPPFPNRKSEIENRQFPQPPVPAAEC
jgi:hypothetical protein